MSTTAQNYYADGRSLKKLYREFTLSDELLAKIDAIPKVIDNLDSESATDALSANMGRVLKEMINNITIEVDDHLDAYSENPVQNKVIYEALTGYAKVSDVNTKTFFFDGTKLPNDPDNIDIANDVVTFMKDGGKAIIEYGAQTYVAHDHPVQSGDSRYAFYTLDTFSTSNNSLMDMEVLQFEFTSDIVTNVTKTSYPILTVDNILDASSTNPVENGVIVLALAGKANIFSGTSQPTGTGGDLWFNPSTGEIKYYDGTQWTGMGGGGGTTYTAGDGISIDANNEISVDASDLPGYGLLEDGNNNLAVDPSIIATQNDLSGKQDTLTAGAHINITSNVISAINFQEPLVAGTNIQIDPATNVISATDTTYTAGTRITIDQNNVISADMSGVMTYMGNVTDPTGLPSSGQNQGDCWYSESDGHLYAWDGTQWNDIGGTGPNLTNYFNKTVDDTDDITEGATNKFVTIAEKNLWNAKQDQIIAGNNITINADGKTINAVIPAPITYQAGNGITIDNNTHTISAVPYTAGTGISISNNVITNTAPFNPGSGSSGQVLKSDGQGGCYWGNESGGGTTPNDGRLRITYGSDSWDFTANQAGNTTVNIPVPSVNVNVSNREYGPAWDGQTNTAPSQNAVYDAIEDVKSTISTPGAGVLTLKQGTDTIGTFSANATQNKTLVIPAGTKYIDRDTNLWELAPGDYLIGTPEQRAQSQSGDPSSWKLYCKEASGTAYEGVHYFKGYYGAMLHISLHNESNPTLPVTRNGRYYNVTDGWYLNYGYADRQRGTYRQLTLHQNDPYQLGEVSGNLVLNLHESTSYSMIITGDTTITFGDLDDDPNTFGATQGHVFSILIMQDDVGGHRITFDETRVRVLKASGYAQDTTRNSISRLVVDKQEFWNCRGTSNEVQMKHDEDPSNHQIGMYYFASISRYS